MSEISHRQVAANGINFHIAEAGEGPLVILLHGFPESWYSWRHQLTALGEIPVAEGIAYRDGLGGPGASAQDAVAAVEMDG